MESKVLKDLINTSAIGVIKEAIDDDKRQEEIPNFGLMVSNHIVKNEDSTDMQIKKKSLSVGYNVLGGNSG